MRRNSRTVILPTKGIDIGVPGTLIDARAVTRCQNLEVSRQLIRKSRGGINMGDPLGERVLAYAELERDNITHPVRFGPTKAETWTGSAWVNILDDDGEDPPETIELSGNADTRVAVAYPELGGAKVLVYSNYVDPPRVWTGTGVDAALGGSPPKAKHLLNYFGFLLMANVVDGDGVRRSRVRWCDAGDIETWAPAFDNVANAVDLLEDDLEITAMDLFGDFVTVHKERAIYMGYLTGTRQVLRFDRKETGSGTIAAGTVINLPTGEQIFLSREGLRLFNGITAPLIQNAINEELNDSMNVAHVGKSFGVHVRELNEVWFGIPIGSDTVPSTIYKYNYLLRTIWKDRLATDLTAAGLFTKAADDTWDSDPEPWDSDVTPWDYQTALALHKRVLWGVGETGQGIERTDSADFATAAIDARGETKDFTAADFELDDPESVFLEWQGVEVVARGTFIDIAVSVNEGESWNINRRLMLGSSFPVDSAPKVAYFRAVSSKCRFRFSNAAAGGAFELKQFRPIAIPREARVPL